MPWLVSYVRNGTLYHEIDHMGPRRNKETRLRTNETRVPISEDEARMAVADLVEALANPEGILGGA